MKHVCMLQGYYCIADLFPQRQHDPCLSWARIQMNVAVQWVHVLALMGDTSDNVPGVPGVGAKGALSLIQEYGTVESVLENADKVRCGSGVSFVPEFS